MLIVCPRCATSYMVDPGALGPAGRTVRCARCKIAWHAGGPEPKPAMAGYVDGVIAEAQAREHQAAAPPRPASLPPSAPPAQAAAGDDFGEEPAAPIADAAPPAAEGTVTTEVDAALPVPAEAEPAPLADAPSLVPPNEHDPLPEPAGAAPESSEIESFAARRTRLQARRKQMRKSSKWTAMILVLLGLNVAIVGARNEVVGFLPQTASLFAAIGLPVNLRGLDFKDVKISQEDSDGVKVLVVEGAIVSSSSRPVEVPRLRFAIRNSSGQEIYSWTALPSRSILGPGETLPFRSRLASPPAAAGDIVVRFFTARDATGAK